jgi:hypothetical protein
VIPKQRVKPADPIQGSRLPDLVASGRVQVQSLLGMVQRVLEPTLPLGYLGKVHVGMGLSNVLAIRSE